ncbi:MAG: hypothetical protein JRE23_08170 [Deltaproteobacteria bacterium]|nr:hypothetical protein [Deltaproteobacteria bacterium]
MSTRETTVSNFTKAASLNREYNIQAAKTRRSGRAVFVRHDFSIFFFNEALEKLRILFEGKARGGEKAQRTCGT